MELIGPIPKGTRRGWEVRLNGEIVEEVTELEISSRFGNLRYGMRQEGYDGLLFHETGGGGSVTIPYFIKNPGEIFVGMVWQSRPTQGGFVWNVPRGFLAPGESHFAAAGRELAEETGFTPLQERIRLLGGGVNPNSAFFDTSLMGEEMLCGVNFFALEVDSNEVEAQQDGTLRFREGFLRGVSRVGETILGCAFHPISFAISVSDMFTVAGCARLLQYLGRV